MKKQMRVWHRYLGFFLSGIMAVYAISGVVLIFRNTDFLKVEQQVERELEPGLDANALGRALKIRDLQAEEESGANIVFAGGQYDKGTGVVSYRSKELPVVLDKMTKMHKARSGQPLFYLNLFFGASLLFFVISSFFMFLPNSKIFKRGMYVALAGIVLTLVMVYF
ncbi:PepSY domain-containing protein [Coraliomargarita sp. SDUM461004]|uniref:PepSY domain-containing protein n=1 Tax=Thalassobacterium sedimentorum TaxID=3041258 RepID=A0ABU1AN27_9BACT|nr:PepSY domain-containing protein [Coraliomargarita sp. SDUM461004]MDQ8196200.1 PepSY domain-containing protein [Coraliomargarita sp. SDUM461004]